VATDLAALLDGDIDEFEVEYPCHSPDERRWFLMRAAAFTVADSRYVAVAHIDITDRVESEQESELFERIIESAGQVVFITDAHGTITYVNPAFEEVTGYTATEAIGQTPRLLTSGEHDEAFYEDLWETILAGNEWNGHLINRRKSGGLYYAHQRIVPITDETGNISQFVALQTEITEIEEMKRQLRAHDDLLRHELRTQLSVIQGRAEQIQEEDGAVDTAVADAILGATEQLLETAEKTRELQRFLERTTDPEPVDIVSVVTEVVRAERDRFPEATITCDLPTEVVALAVDVLPRALRELIENSIVHNDREHPHVSVTGERVADGVDITVEDDGPGIPPMEYESFEETVPTQVNHRSGVGLDMAYWIARRSGGKLLVEQREPRGSLVTLHLPSIDEGGQ